MTKTKILVSTCSSKSWTGGFLFPQRGKPIGLYANDISRTEPSDEDSKPVALQRALEIPRKPKPAAAPEPDVALETNGTSVTGKRKREGEDESLTNGHVAKKVVGEPTVNGGERDLIVLDEDEGGAILIDD